jgi:hypothetical protein
MHIIVVAWIYVVLMMSITEQSVVAGIMTFLSYCLFPLSIILYVLGTPQRKRKREEAEKKKHDQGRSDGMNRQHSDDRPER